MGNKKDYLIYGVICLAITSAITTGLGVNIILDDYSNIIRNITAFLIATGTSCLMIGLGLQVDRASQEKKLPALLIVYLIVAILSLFFNFCTFYNSQAKGTILTDDIEILSKNLSRVRADLGNIPNVKYSVDNLKSTVENAIKGMAFEKKENGGEGNNYKNHKKQWIANKPKLDAALESAKKDALRLNSIVIPLLDSADSKINLYRSDYDDKKLKVKAREELKQYYTDATNQLVAYYPEYKYPPFKLTLEKASSSSFALDAILDFIADKLPQEDYSRFYLSVFLSFILDFPIFISLIFLGSQEDYQDRIRHVISPVTESNIKPENYTKPPPEDKEDIDIYWQ